MTCRLTEIFEAQRELMNEFHAIESANGFRVESSVPVDLDNPHDQLRLKEFAWRISEEVGEAVLALTQHGMSSKQYREEISDVMHFYAELCLIAGITPSMICPSAGPDRLKTTFLSVANEYSMGFEGYSLQSFWLHVVVALSQAMNNLKNRPWKRTMKPTDRTAFREHLINTFREFVAVCLVSGMNEQDLYDQYFHKRNINQQRQLTGV
jgi:dimeric dUTPase (all-alpha-NTP-PPase superfamily)